MDTSKINNANSSILSDEEKIRVLVDNYRRARREVIGHDLYDIGVGKMKTRARGAWLRLVEAVGSEEEARALVDLR